MASAEFTEESKQKRPNVQVGDPFMEKLLLEACIEAMHNRRCRWDSGHGRCRTYLLHMRDGEPRRGRRRNRARPRTQRETGMTPYEIMLSESQERMLLVADKGREEEVFRVFRKWGLEAVEIGTVTGDGKLRVRHHGEVVAEIPNRELADEAPLYSRPYTVPPRGGLIPNYPSTKLQRTLADDARPLPISAPNAGSGSSTTIRCAPIRWPVRKRTDAAIIRIKETGTSDRDVARWQRPLLLSVAARGRETRGGRVLPQSFHGGRASRGRD